MKGWELFTPAERRLAILLFTLAALGQFARWGGRVSPEVARWLEGDPRPAPDSTEVPQPPIVAPRSIGPDTVKGASPETSAVPPVSPAERIDPNTADLAALLRLPGVGPVLAARILEDRTRGGPYRRAEDLLRVSGIGPAKLAKIKPHLVFGGVRGG